MNEQIHLLLKLMRHLRPYQKTRLLKWIAHYERTGEYLKPNFDRLQKTLEKFLARKKN